MKVIVSRYPDGGREKNIVLISYKNLILHRNLPDSEV